MVFIVGYIQSDKYSKLIRDIATGKISGIIYTA